MTSVLCVQVVSNFSALVNSVRFSVNELSHSCSTGAPLNNLMALRTYASTLMTRHRLLYCLIHKRVLNDCCVSVASKLSVS